MDFTSVTKLCILLSKPFAEDLMRLLMMYRDISASEAASRLDLHIKTAQDFLDGLVSMEIAGKEEVSEGKRPYFRYRMRKEKITVEIDFTALYDDNAQSALLKKEDTRTRQCRRYVFHCG